MQTKTRQRSERTSQTKRCSKGEAAALRKNHVVRHGPLVGRLDNGFDHICIDEDFIEVDLYVMKPRRVNEEVLVRDWYIQLNIGIEFDHQFLGLAFQEFNIVANDVAVSVINRIGIDPVVPVDEEGGVIHLDRSWGRLGCRCLRIWRGRRRATNE